MYKRFFVFLITMVVLQLQQAMLSGQTRDEKVRNDRDELKDDDSWYYDDLETAIGVARQENKPLMVVLRCIP